MSLDAAHRILTRTPVDQAPLGRVYARRCRQVAELLARLREIDSEWARHWEAKERVHRDE